MAARKRKTKPSASAARDALPQLANRLELWSIEKPVPDPRNPRQHPAGQLARIAESITRFGFVDPILVSESGQVIAGHGRLDAARLLELEEVPVLVVDHLSDEERRALLLAHNRLAELSGWDEDLLAAELGELAAAGFDLSPVGFDDAELGRLLGTLPGAGPEGSSEETEEEAPPPEPPRRSAVRRGDLWTAGRHRVLCADSFDQPELDRLIGQRKVGAVVTDPPYAIYGSATGLSADVADDRMVRPFFRGVLEIAQRVLAIGGTAHIFCDWRSWASWWDEARSMEVQIKNCLVWDKGDQGIGRNYRMCHELVAYLVKVRKADKIFGDHLPTGVRPVQAGNVLRFNRAAGEERKHHAAKPVPLLVEILGHVAEKALVLDPFLGSGSTMIAAERAGLAALGVEVEPKWVEASLLRWERETGGQAEMEGRTLEDVRKERARAPRRAKKPGRAKRKASAKR